jgi:hypothetical protein
MRLPLSPRTNWGLRRGRGGAGGWGGHRDNGESASRARAGRQWPRDGARVEGDGDLVDVMQRRAGATGAPAPWTRVRMANRRRTADRCVARRQRARVRPRRAPPPPTPATPGHAPGRADDDLSAHGRVADLDARVAGVCEVAREELVHLGVEDAVGDELALLGDAGGWGGREGGGRGRREGGGSARRARERGERGEHGHSKKARARDDDARRHAAPRRRSRPRPRLGWGLGMLAGSGRGAHPLWTDV